MITRQQKQRGLVLLIVLGMLGLFSLLAVTYMVYSGQSRTSGIIINQAKLQDTGKIVYDPDIISLVLRGSRNSTSVFSMHSLLGDVYGRESIEGEIQPYANSNPTGFVQSNSGNRNADFTQPHGAMIVGAEAAVTAPLRSDMTFCKVPLNRDNATFSLSGTQQLNRYDDSYNGRVFTMLEGPLANHSFRVLKYIGWEDQSTTDVLAYSIMIDLAELPKGIEIEGQVTGLGTYRANLSTWLSNYGPNSFFYDEFANPYRFLMNDAVYNGVGYGVHPGAPGSTNPVDIGGNLTQYWTGSFANRGTTLLPRPNGDIVPVGLLPNMDYMDSLNVLGSSNEGFDVADFRDFWLSSIDPNGDFRDASGNAGINPAQIIPSFHRPELINYIWQLYESGTGLANRSTGDIQDLLRMVDFACARPLAVSLNGLPLRTGQPTNNGFNIGSTTLAGLSRDYVNLTWSNMPTAAEQNALRDFLGSLVQGPWDVDNDGDGIAEGVWLDPGLPTITGPDGKTLKVMTSVHIEDLDNRINVNLAGDIMQAMPSYGNNMSLAITRRQTTNYTNNEYLAQGSGLGPGDLTVNHLRQLFDTSMLTKVQAQLQFTQALMKARNGNDAPTGHQYELTGVPGRRNDKVTVGSVNNGAGNTGDDYASYLQENGLTSINSQWAYTVGAGTYVYPRAGYPLMTHGRTAFGIDLNGNVSTYRPPLLNPSTGVAFVPDEIAEDPYELSQNESPEDSPFTLEELERVVRRYDGDVRNLSDRLMKILELNDDPAGTRFNLAMQINKVITTRSHELRNPPIGFPGRDQANNGVNGDLGLTRPHPVGSLMEWVALLHEHHYRVVSNPNTLATEHQTADNTLVAANDPSAIKPMTTTMIVPPLTPEVLRALFPLEFRRGLRMNLNRPFGNGFVENTSSSYHTPDDYWGAGGTGVNLPVVVDEPLEVSVNNGAYEVVRQYPYDGVSFAQIPQGYFSLVTFRNNLLQTYPYDGTGVAPTYRTVPSGMNAFQQRAFNGLASRQFYARQLYCLAQLLVPQDYRFVSMAGLTYPSRDWYKRRARTLAQWAINVVDFRDPDAIMTRFEFDYLPFGIRDGALGGTLDGAFDRFPGWRPEPGDIVWGMEYPELLLTETLALHDKRVAETRLYASPMGEKPTQYRIPQGSTFIELFNPRTQDLSGLDAQSVPSFPKELYINTGSGIALDLGRLAPASQTAAYGRQPIWRIGVGPTKGQNTANITYSEILNTTGTGGPIQAVTQNYSNQVSEELATTVTTLGGDTGDPVIANGLFSDLSEIGTTTGTSNLEFERVIWFNGNRPTSLGISRIPNLRGPTTHIDHKVFFNRRVTAGNPVPLQAGSYAVVAPRQDTVIGSIVDPNLASNTDPQYQPSPQRLRVTATGIEHTRLNGNVANNRFAAMIKPALTMIAQADPPDRTTWEGNAVPQYPLAENEGIGISVSEPLPTPTGYYPIPNQRLNSNTGSGYDNRRPDAYVDLNSSNQLETDILDDEDMDDAGDSFANPYLANGVWNSHQTHTDFCQVYLQRLADPTQGYDPYLNPYITVDTMSVDLSLYTGENPGGDYDSNGSHPVSLNANNLAFESRFKDGRSMKDVEAAPVLGVGTTPATRSSNIGSYVSSSTANLIRTAVHPAPPSNVYFAFELGYQNPGNITSTHSSLSLGYLNVGHQLQPDAAVFVNDAYGFQPIPGSFDGFGPPRNIPFDQNNGVFADFRGTSHPEYCQMTSLFWPNRQFANAAELMMVPWTAPGQLGGNYTTGQVGGSFNMYQNAPSDPESLPEPFGHLINFFESSDKHNTTLPPANEISQEPPALSNYNTPRREPFWMHRNAAGTSQGNGFGLMLELVETPPRYAEASRLLNPAAIDPGFDSADGGVIDAIRRRMLSDYLSPNNFAPTYTNPGKININTLVDEPVWNSIEWNLFQDLSSRGSAVGNVRWTEPAGITNAAQPTIVGMRRGYAVNSGTVARTILGATYSDLNPNIHHLIPTQFAGAHRSPFASNITAYIASPSDTNLLQKYRPARDATVTSRRAGDALNPLEPGATSGGMLLTAFSPQNEQLSQPLAAYQRLMRTSNLVTNQSNVFAVWITVGLFEYDPINGLGKEYVSPNGKANRQRSFYIIDRTVPVAYREGENYNTEKAVLLRRNIAR